jgi:hypothetical protein
VYTSRELTYNSYTIKRNIMAEFLTMQEAEDKFGKKGIM